MKAISTIICLTVFAIASQGQGLLNNNGEIICKGTVNVVIKGNGNWVNNGTFSADSSNLVLIGDNDQAIDGTNRSTFHKLSINKSNGDLIIERDIDVVNSITLTNGDIDLKNSTIDLQGTGIIQDETETNRIKVGDTETNTGTIKYTRTINNVSDFDPANLGIKITTDQNMGTVTVTRGHNKLAGTGSFSGNSSIARYYDIPGIGELNGTSTNIEMQYWESEMGIEHPEEANLLLFQSVSQAGENFWTELTSSINTVNNTISPDADPYKSYIYGPAHTSISFNEKFTLGSSDSPLPVELLSFGVKKQSDELVKIIWETSAEINNDYFIVEKTRDLKNWFFVNKLKGAGNSNTTSEYSCYDFDPLPGLSYYRLKQVDFDNDYSFSDIKTIFIGKHESIYVYPNPTNGMVNIAGNNIKKIEVLNAQGQILNTFEEAQTEINLSDYPQGTYIFKITNEENTHIRKIVLR